MIGARFKSYDVRERAYGLLFFEAVSDILLNAIGCKLLFILQDFFWGDAFDDENHRDSLKDGICRGIFKIRAIK